MNKSGSLFLDCLDRCPLHAEDTEGVREEVACRMIADGVRDDNIIARYSGLNTAQVKEIRYREISSERYVSIVSLWEMAIKTSLGKLKLPRSIKDIAEYCEENDIHIKISVRGWRGVNRQRCPWYKRDRESE